MTQHHHPQLTVVEGAGPAEDPGLRIRCRLVIRFLDPEGRSQIAELRMSNGAEKLRPRARMLRQVIKLWLSIQGGQLLDVQLHDDDVLDEVPIRA